MNQKIYSRIETLEAEFDKGRQRLDDLRVEETRLKEAMLRIHGAITALKELVSEDKHASEPGVIDIEERKSA
ncbi:hypothetical protein ACO0K9_03470 [Undibacterium sp. Ji50W]|uniref:hypothetical protein n=1 Tax=Undibacterium sp. Ji50W TaxID=3413041 RepID=UPI003BF0BDFA